MMRKENGEYRQPVVGICIKVGLDAQIGRRARGPCNVLSCRGQAWAGALTCVSGLCAKIRGLWDAEPGKQNRLVGCPSAE